jgi:hypothetical protein
MPRAEARPEAVVFYQRLTLPLVRDRDYVLRTHFDETPGENGTTYRLEWRPCHESGPEPTQGVLRVSYCEGAWLLEPQDKMTTRATYTIFTDAGGALPAFAANTGSRMAIRKIFAAIRKQVTLPKYAAP